MRFQRMSNAMVGFGLLFMAVQAQSQQPMTFQYFYDDLNQLVKVLDSSGVLLEYVYDAAGNLLQVKRSLQPSGALSVFSFTPQQGGQLSQITIYGQGFSSTPASNVVKIGGLQATVLSATSSTLTVLVPVGASTGSVTITVGSNTATAPAQFVVVPVPVITSLSPHGSLANSTIGTLRVTGVNLAGSSFAFTPANTPPAIQITSTSIDSSGTSAILSANISASAVGTFVLTASNSTGSSSPIASLANSFAVVLNPNADTDGDGLPDGLELTLNTNPFNADTDGDGYFDGVEIASSSDPLNAACTPMNCRLAGFAEGLQYSLVNASRGIASYEADTVSISVLSVLGSGSTAGEMDSVPMSVCRNSSGASCPGFSGLPSVISGLIERDPFKSLERNLPPEMSPVSQTRQPFSVVAVVPSNNATDVPTDTIIAVSFSSSLAPQSLSASNIHIAANDQALTSEVRLSADFRTVLLTTNLPSDSLVTILITGDTKDLYGRALPLFQSTFRTAANTRSRPVVRAQRPSIGATGVAATSAIELVLNNAITWRDAFENLVVTQGGQEVEGAIQVISRGKLLTFRPSFPFAPGAIVHVKLGSVPADSKTNNPAYEGFFTVAPDIAERLEPLRISHMGTQGVAAGELFEVEFNHALDFSSVSPETVGMTSSATGTSIATSVTLRDDKTVRIRPAAPLLAGETYSLDLASQLCDFFGQHASPFRLEVRTKDQLGRAPIRQGIAASPNLYFDQATEIRISFDRPINVLTADQRTIELKQGSRTVEFSLSFLENGREVIVTPHRAFQGAAAVELRCSGIEDLLGRRIPDVFVLLRPHPNAQVVNSPLTKSPELADMVPVRRNPGLASPLLQRKQR